MSDLIVIHRCVELALAGLRCAYPNKIGHVLDGPEDVATPRELTPIFYGCFDWHSAVHGHWLLARCCRLFPAEPFAEPSRAFLRKALTEDLVAREVAYLAHPSRAGFERPYGIAWLLQLAAELRGWDDPEADAWSAALRPLETLAAKRLLDWLPRLTHPIRTGEHSQTAFAMGLALDWSPACGHDAMRALLTQRARDFHLDDQGWSLAFEPSGHDFLSPGLSEADLLRRVLDERAFSAWLDRFLPELRGSAGVDGLAPVTAAHSTDGKLAHLDGLNLSRAWMLEGIREGLPDGDVRRPALAAAADRHCEAGLAALARDDYARTHWLGTFAVYLVTRRGLDKA